MDFMQCTPGITTPSLSREPLGTEGELTPGPDDENPYEDELNRVEQRGFTLKEDPTTDPDPYVFDDVEGVVDELSLPGLEDDRRMPRF